MEKVHPSCEMLGLNQLSVDEAIRAKCGLLTAGISIDGSVSSYPDPYKRPVQAIYGYYQDQKPIERYPEEIFIFESRESNVDKVAVKVRENPISPNRLVIEDNKPVLETESRMIPVLLAKTPSFYGIKTTGNTELQKMVQMLGTDTLGVIVSNFCSYFSSGDECVFCEIVPSYTEAREYGKSAKPIQELQEAMQLAINSGEVERIALTTGNYDDKNAKTLSTLIELFGGLDTSTLKQVCVLYYPVEEIGQYRALQLAGVTDVMHNIEAWFPDQFVLMAPGKEKHLGRNNLIAKLEEAVDIFGPGHVFSNFVYGIQSLKDYNPQTFDQQRENEILLEATNDLLKRGIIPMFTVYHTTGKNKIGPINISPEILHEFGIDYGTMVYQSGIVPETRSGAHGSLGSSGNHLFNDYFYLARENARK